MIKTCFIKLLCAISCMILCGCHAQNRAIVEVSESSTHVYTLHDAPYDALVDLLDYVEDHAEAVEVKDKPKSFSYIIRFEDDSSSIMFMGGYMYTNDMAYLVEDYQNVILKLKEILALCEEE